MEALADPVYVCWQTRNGILIRCDKRDAQGVMSGDGNTIYQLQGKQLSGVGSEELLSAVSITLAEYEELAAQVGTTDPDDDTPVNPPDDPGTEILTRAQLTEKASKDAMSQMLTATRNIVSSVRGVPLSIKYPVANKIYGYLGDTIFSTVFSNLGVVKLPPELADHIDYMDFALGTNVSHRVSNALITFGDTATFSISKMTLDPSFEEKLLDLLQKDSISAEIEGSVQYGH